MQADECLCFFESIAEVGAQRGPKLVATGKADAWLAHGLTASRHSPGVVQPNELLFRSIKQKHVDDLSNQIHPDAVEDISKRGLSLDRLEHRPIELAIQAAKNRPAAVGAIGGYVAVQASQLSAVSITAARQVGLFDTATEENPAHAEAFVIVSCARDERLELKSKVLDVMKPLFKKLA
jgi:hypothetical protein